MDGAGRCSHSSPAGEGDCRRSRWWRGYLSSTVAILAPPLMSAKRYGCKDGEGPRPSSGWGLSAAQLKIVAITLFTE